MITCGRGQHPGRMSRVRVGGVIFMSLVFLSCFRAFKHFFAFETINCNFRDFLYMIQTLYKTIILFPPTWLPLKKRKFLPKIKYGL